jgi:Lipid A core - O-antigen ligase and related enzymes
MAFSQETKLQCSFPGSRLILLIAIILGVAGVYGVAATKNLLLAVAAVLVLSLGFAIVAWPEIATLVVIFLLYSNLPVVAVKFHGVPYLLGAAYLGLLVIPIIVYLVFLRQRLIIPSILPLMLFFLVIQLVGALFSEDRTIVLSAVVTFVIEGILLFLLIINTVRTPKILRRVIWVLLLAGVFMNVVPFYQQMTKTYGNNYGGLGQVSEKGLGTGEVIADGEVRQFRLASTIGEQNRFAQIMIMLIPLGLFRFWGERKKVLRALALAATGIIVLGMVLTFSRGAAVSLALLVVLMMFMRLIKPYHLIIATGACLLLMMVIPQYWTRLATLQGAIGIFSEEGNSAYELDGSITGRATEMLAAAMVFADHPIIGVGSGMFKYYAQEYGNTLNIRYLEEDRRAHSMYLEIAAENGALGLICFLAILYVMLRNLARTRKRWADERPELANMATSLMLAIIAYLMSGLFMHLSYMRYFWFMLALGEASSYMGSAMEQSSLSNRGLETQGKTHEPTD